MPPATNWDVLHLYSISNMIQISLAPRLYSVDPDALSLVRRGSQVFCLNVCVQSGPIFNMSLPNHTACIFEEALK